MKIKKQLLSIIGLGMLLLISCKTTSDNKTKIDNKTIETTESISKNLKTTVKKEEKMIALKVEASNCKFKLLVNNKLVVDREAHTSFVFFKGIEHHLVNGKNKLEVKLDQPENGTPYFSAKIVLFDPEKEKSEWIVYEKIETDNKGVLAYTDGKSVKNKDTVVRTTKVDPKVKIGKKIFIANCAACHKMKGKLIGPELQGISDKREREWLHLWIKDNNALRKSGDALAKQVFEENNKMPMTPYPQLSEEDIDALLAYFKVGNVKKVIVNAAEARQTITKLFDLNDFKEKKIKKHTMLFIDGENCEVEIEINDISLEKQHITNRISSSIPVDKYLINGENLVKIKITPIEQKKSSIELKLVSIGDDTASFFDESSWDKHVVIKNKELLKTENHSKTFKIKKEYNLTWETAPKIKLDKKTIKKIDAFMKKIYTAIKDKKAENIMPLFKYYRQDMALINPKYDIKAWEAMDIEGLNSREEPLEKLKKGNYKLVANGKLVTCIGADELPLIRCKQQEDGYIWKMPIYIGLVNDEFYILLQ